MRYVGDALEYDNDVYWADEDNNLDTDGDGDKTNDEDYVHNAWFYYFKDLDLDGNDYIVIQNIDYDLAQDTFGIDTGQEFMAKWGTLAAASLSDYILHIFSIYLCDCSGKCAFNYIWPRISRFL